MSKILVVDDDASFARATQKLLEQEKWKVEVAFCGTDGLQLINNFSYDLVLLDWEMPDITGIEICKKVRAEGKQIPIIFLTGKVEVNFLVTAFEYGADDYVEKGAEVRELIARIRGVLRKKSQSEPAKIAVGDATLNARMRSLDIGGKRLDLTSTETELLEYLMLHEGEAFSSSQLFDAVWESSSTVSSETVRVHVTLLRRKLESVGHKGFIKTLPSKGYTIDRLG